METTMIRPTKSENIFKNKQVLLMGILNVTPDSFHDGGKHNTVDAAVEHIEKMIAEGADIIDIGGESTRPGADSVGLEEELNRVIPVIDTAVKNFKELKDGSVTISIDTYKSAVAKKALDSGAGMLNDISGLRFDSDMVRIVKERNVPAVVMHMQGTPKNMQKNPIYTDVVSEIKSFFSERIKFLTSHGIPKENIILDPGIGFGKTTEHNLKILSRLKEFQTLNQPILLGTSRKSFIGKTLESESSPLPTGQRLEGSVVTYIWAVMNGVKILRVHDVKETKYALKMFNSIRGMETEMQSK